MIETQDLVRQLATVKARDAEKEIESLRQQLKNSRKSATNGWNAYEDLRQASDEMIIELRQQLADLQAKYDAREQECRTAFGKEMELRKQLAAAERTLDETAPWRELQAENKRLQQQLAECKKERNDLYKMGLTQSKTINRLEDLLFKAGADKTGEV